MTGQDMYEFLRQHGLDGLPWPFIAPGAQSAFDQLAQRTTRAVFSVVRDELLDVLARHEDQLRG